jgi:hypothetical protein
VTAEPPFLLIVPIGAAASMVAPGSAVVAKKRDGGYDSRYEGGLHSAMDWSEKVLHAAGRLATSYPTSAMAFLGPEDAVVVGEVGRDPHTDDWVVTRIDDADALREWRGGEDSLEGATEEQRRRAAGIALSRGGGRVMRAYAAAVAGGGDAIAAVLASR